MIIPRNQNNQCSASEEQINSQINRLKDQGITYYYDRRTRLNKNRNRPNNLELSSRIYKYGIITILLFCILIVIVWLNLQKSDVITGREVNISMAFFHPEGIKAVEGGEVESQIKLYLHAPNNSVVIPEKTQIKLLFEKHDQLITQKTITFPKAITIYPNNPLPFLVQVKKIDFLTATQLRIESKELEINGSKTIRQ